MSNQTKKCPFCAETIQAEAIVCRFCKRETEEPILSNRAAAKKNSQFKRLMLIAVMGGFIVCCGWPLSLVVLNHLEYYTVDTSGSREPAPYCKDIIETYNSQDTSVRKDEYVANLGKEGNLWIEEWTGEIKDVNYNYNWLTAGYNVSVIITSGMNHDIVILGVRLNTWCHANFVINDEEVASSLLVGQQVTVTGQVQSVRYPSDIEIYLRRGTVEIDPY